MERSPPELAEYEVRLFDEGPGPTMIALVHRPSEGVVLVDEQVTLRTLIGAARSHMDGTAETLAWPGR